MKNISLLLILLMTVNSAVIAQVDRSKIPEPGPAPEIQLPSAETFSLENGLKVFVVTNSKLPRVAFSLVLDRDPLFEGEKAGLTGFVGEMMMAGTSTRTKEELDEEVDFIGASLNAGSTSIFASSLKKHQVKILELMTDVLYNPIFPEEELEKQKRQALTSLAASKDDPNYISGVLSNAVVFGKNHPYGENQTEETVKNIDIEDIKEYYHTYFKPNIAFLAIVGDIEKPEAEKLVKEYFEKWEKGDVPAKEYDRPELPSSNNVALVNRSTAVQSVINVAYPLEMKLSNEDYLATRVLNFILGGGFNSRLNSNLRETKGYTYGARSTIGEDKLITRFSANASVRTEVTGDAIKEMLFEIRNIAENGITEGELESAKANLSGSFGRALENPSTIANFAINIERYGLPEDYYINYLQRLDALTVDDINRAAKEYILPENMYITVVGNAGEFQDHLEEFGEIKMYNSRGDEASEISFEDTDMSAEQVIENYFTAIGGKEAAENVKTAKIEMSAEIQGTRLTMVSLHDVPNQKMVQKVMMMGNEASKTVLKEGKATINSMGQSQTLTDEQYEDIKMSMWVFPELHYEQLGYTLSLDGIVDVEGDAAYKMIIANPTGGEVINYYSVDSGLKIKSENEITGETSYLKYEEFEGLQFPVEITLKNPMIPVPLNSKLESLDFNPSLSETDFN